MRYEQEEKQIRNRISSRALKLNIFLCMLTAVSLLFSYDNAEAGSQTFDETPKTNNITNVEFKNGSFEDPDIFTTFPAGSRHTTLAQVQSNLFNFIPMAAVDGWSTRVVDPAHATDIYAGHIEIDRENFVSTPAHEGHQFAELNANVPGTLYQECDTQPGQKLYWEFYHRGRTGTDTMRFLLNGEFIREAKTDHTGWKRYYGSYVADSYKTEFAFQSAGSSTGALTAGNFLDSIRLFNPAFLEVEKTVTAPASDGLIPMVLSGQILSYRVAVTNTGEAETSRTLFTDILPDGVELLPDSITVTYVTANGTTEELDITGLVDFDPDTDLLQIEIGREITDAKILDENDNEIDNTDAIGTSSIARNDSVIITFDVRVTGENIAGGDLIRNQAKVFYNDLGFEKYNVNSQGEIEEDYNVSNITEVRYLSRGTLTIGKEITAVSDQMQTFLFKIDCQSSFGDKIYYGTLSIEAGDTDAAVRFDKMPPGNYTVTEIFSNWEYQITDLAAQSQAGELNGIDILTQAFTVINEKEEKAWIFAKARAENHFAELP